ncbi:MAG: hypothetical protein AB1780_07505 [Pseudomonadota bacterium]
MIKQLSDKVVQGLEELSNRTQSYAQQLKQDMQNRAARTAAKAAKPVLDYIVDSARRIIIDTAKHQLDRFLSPRLF